MDKNNELLDVPTINAAVAGEAWAVEKVIEHYADEINGLCTIQTKLPNGKIVKVLDEDMRQDVTLTLIESLSKFEV